MISHAMATEKVSLTLDEKTVREARRVAGKRGLSAFVEDALSTKLQHDRLRAWLKDAERTHGPIPQEVREKVRKQWQEVRRSRRVRGKKS